jgi:hypothetical protein
MTRMQAAEMQILRFLKGNRKNGQFKWGCKNRNGNFSLNEGTRRK